jgi:hypothetical protein
MDIPSSITDMDKELADFRIENSVHLAPAVREALADAGSKPSPVDRFVSCMETLYAARDDLNDAGKTIVAQLASFCAMHGWPGGDTRPNLIQQAMRRELGEKAPGAMKWPKRDDDPEATVQFGTVEPAAPQESDG